jgi:hypothetical protein
MQCRLLRRFVFFNRNQSVSQELAVLAMILADVCCVAAVFIPILLCTAARTCAGRQHHLHARHH